MKEDHRFAPPPPPISTQPNPDYLFMEQIRGRKALFTTIFLVFNILVYVAMEMSGGTTNPSVLLAWGAKSNAAIDAGEWWRSVTPVFIHIGLLHLGFNSYALWIIGQQVEKLYGSARFVILYVLLGIAGVAGSYAYSPVSLSAGASGAIFGLFGVLLVFGYRNRGNVPAFLGRAVGRGILPIILINLVIGFMIPMIDNAAHIGGLVAGIVLGSVMGFQVPGSDTSSGYKLSQAGALALIAVGFLQVLAHYDGPTPSLGNMVAGFQQRLSGTSGADGFIQAINTSQRLVTDVRRTLMDDASDEYLGGLKGTLGDAIDRLDDTPTLSKESDALMVDLLGILEDQYALVESVRRTGAVRPHHVRTLEAIIARHNRVMDDIRTWVATDGERFGLEFR